MDPLLIPRFVVLAFRFWIKLLGPRWFWGLTGLAALLSIVLNYKL